MNYRQKRRGGSVMSCIQGHHSTDVPSITLKKQNGVLTSQRWELREGRQGERKIRKPDVKH